MVAPIIVIYESVHKKCELTLRVQGPEYDN